MKIKLLVIKSLLILGIFLAVGMSSCSEEDSMREVGVPSVSLTETSHDVEFFTAGFGEIPSVNWNGDQGSFLMREDIGGVTIDSITGRILWDKTLKPGETKFTLIAKNSAGETTVPISLNNPLQGVFEGYYTSVDSIDFDYQFRLTLNADGSADIFSEGQFGEGAWEWSEANNITVAYSYPGTGTFILI